MAKRYPINEIFHSLQGEGRFAGMSAVFIRFSGCNLQCPFCDTDHSSKTMMTAVDILCEVAKYSSNNVILTGGEPSLYVDDELISTLRSYFLFIAIETNGTHKLPKGIDWITLSPKQHVTNNAKVVLKSCNELKVIWEDQIDMSKILNDYYGDIASNNYYVQPCDTGNEEINKKLLQQAINFCLNHFHWSLSIQLHKILNIK